MADFSTKATDISSTITPADVIVQPVDRSNEVRALNNIAEAVGVGAKVIQTYRANKAVLEEDRLASEYQIKMTDLADAITQDPSKSDEIKIRMSVYHKNMLAAHPEYQDAFNKGYNNVLSQTGIQRIKTNAEADLEADQAMKKDLKDNGFLSIKNQNNPAAVADAQQRWQDYQFETNKLKQIKDETDLKMSQLNLTDKERENIKKEGERAAVAVTYRVATKSFVVLQNKFDDIKTTLASIKDPAAREQAKAEGIAGLKQMLATARAQLSTGAIGANVDNLSTAITQLDETVKIFEQELDGTIDATVSKNRADAMWNKSKIAAMDAWSPTDRAIIAGANLAGNPTSGIPDVESAFIHMKTNIKAASDPSAKPADILGGTDEERKGVTSYLTLLSGGIQEANQGYIYKSPEDKLKAQEELKNQVEKVLVGVNQYSGTVTNAEDYQAVIDFLAKPETGVFIKANGISDEAMASATAAIANGYSGQVVPLLKSGIAELYKKAEIDSKAQAGGGRANFGAAQKAGKDVMSAKDFIEPTVENGKFGFKLKAGIDPTLASSTAVTTLLKNFNTSDASKVMNKMLSAGANLRKTDVAAEFDLIKDKIFGEDATASTGLDPTTTNSTKADLGFDLGSLAEEASFDNDFAGVDTGVLSSDVAEIAKGVDIGETAGTGDYTTLLGNAQKDGKQFAGTDITKKTVDELIQFTAGGGAYAEYSKGVVNRMATPMGRYQIVGKTLRSLKNKMGLTGDEQFTPELQDKMFLQLLKGRGYFEYKAGKMSKQDFLSNLKNEWEGLHNKKAAAVAGAALNEG
jgi:hypothetical protein